VELAARGRGGNQAIIDGRDRDAVPGERRYALGGFVPLVAAAPTAGVHVDDQGCVVIWRAVDLQLQRGVTDRGERVTALNRDGGSSVRLFDRLTSGLACYGWSGCG
jgi:hypothetical protein